MECIMARLQDLENFNIFEILKSGLPRGQTRISMEYITGIEFGLRYLQYLQHLR